MSSSSVTVAALAPRAPPAFTMAQWQELEQQALIFKYLKAGLPVPPYLLVPIRKSVQLLSPPFFHHPTLDYYSYYGKKIDSEPGRCRRTDGKKWRCSKDAHPDSKYCERHMNRSRNRSRKPVESPSSQSMSTVSSEAASPNKSSSRTFSSLYSPSVISSDTFCFGSNVSQWQMESLPSSKEYRSLDRQKTEADERSFLPEASGSTRSPRINSTLEGTWHVRSQVLPNRTSLEPGNIHYNYPQLQMLQDFESVTVDTAMLKQQQENHRGAFGSSGHIKQENQSLHSLFDGWPKCRGSGSHLIDQGSNEDSSTIQLSMVNPIDPHLGRSVDSSDVT